MGLELPGWLTEPLGWVGLTWPQADEVKVFEAAEAWLAFANTLKPLAHAVDRAAVDVWTTNVGRPAEAFEHWWTAELGPRERLADDVLAAVAIGAGLVLFAAVTLAVKIAFLVQLATLAILVAQAVATAFATFGATAVEIPVIVATARVACQLLVRQGVTQVETGIGGVLGRASILLRPTSGFAHAGEHLPVLDIPAPLRRASPLPTTRLRPEYFGEADPTNPLRPFRPHVVKYLTEWEREEYRLYVRDGKLYQSSTGELFDTSSATNLHTGYGRAIFVMDQDGNLYASNEHRFGIFHHSSFLGGGPVAGAGELEVRDGVCCLISRRSGHYRPTEEHIEQVLAELRSQGLSMDGVERVLTF